jgi:phage gp45-like
MTDSVTREIGRRVRNASAAGVTTGPISIGQDGLPVVQVRLNTLELINLRVVEQRGFGSDLPVGTPVTANFIGGDRSNGYITGSTSPNDRPPTSSSDDRVIFAHGYYMILQADGVHFSSNVPKVFIDGCDLVVTGNITATGNVTAGLGTGDQVDLLNHTHTAQGPYAVTSKPNPGT